MNRLAIGGPRAEVLLLVGLTHESENGWRLEAGRLFRIREAMGCKGAAAFLDTDTPAVVMCDQHLPDGSWKDLLEVMASVSDPPPLVVTSRLADERLWAEVLNLGGYDLLTRPLDRCEVRRVLGLARLHRFGRWQFNGARLASPVGSP